MKSDDFYNSEELLGRLESVRKEKKMTYEYIGNFFGVTKAGARKWFTVECPPGRVMDLAMLFDCNPYWLTFEEGATKERHDSLTENIKAIEQQIPAYDINAWEDANELAPDDIMIPVYDVQLAAGDGTYMPEYVETKKRLPFSLDWIQRKGYKPSDLKLMKVKGDSMITTLYDGDMVLINTAMRDIVDGKVYAIMVGNESKIKRLTRRYDGGLVVISENDDPIYKDEIVEPEDLKYVYVIGRAVHRSGDI